VYSCVNQGRLVCRMVCYLLYGSEEPPYSFGVAITISSQLFFHPCLIARHMRTILASFHCSAGRSSVATVTVESIGTRSSLQW
jgi:hypothetical protein